jgi:hypothetical protein
VLMSRARKARHLFTDSKVALREAVAHKSSRLSPWELIAGGKGDHTQKEMIARPAPAKAEKDLRYASTR